MKTLDVIIPTRNRREKLARTLDSIAERAAGAEVRKIVVCDADRETASWLMSSRRDVFRITFVRDHSGSVYCRNLATAAADDAVLYATDDIVFEPSAIASAVALFTSRFPDEDGVVGFSQRNHGNFSPAGVAIVGRTFLARYPGKRLFFPGYFHFACQEIARAGKLLNRIELCPEAGLHHFHPMLDAADLDRTHAEARKFRLRDKVTSAEREAAGLTWGVNG